MHHHRRGHLTAAPWIWLDQDARRPGIETITIVPGHQPWILLCAHSATGNGIGSFRSLNAQVVVDDGRGSTVTVPLYRRNKFSNWVAVALLDGTGPDGLRVTQVERYGEPFSERRPQLHPDGTFEMSTGPLPREK